jgi:PhnB protein
MKGVKPYISFDGNCREAMTFYKEALGGEFAGILSYGDSGQGSAADKDKIMHSVLKIGDTVIMAADDLSGKPVDIGGNISLAIGVDDVDTTEQMFAKMSEGATITMALAETFWAARFGMLKDKFGIHWMFNCEKPHGQNAA